MLQLAAGSAVPGASQFAQFPGGGMVVGRGESWNASGAGAGARIPEGQAMVAGAHQGGAVAEEPSLGVAEDGDLGGVAGPARAAAGRGLGQVEDACASWGVTVAAVFDRDAVVADPGDRAVPVLREAELDLGGPVLGLPGTGLPAAMFPEGLAM